MFCRVYTSIFHFLWSACKCTIFNFGFHIFIVSTQKCDCFLCVVLVWTPLVILVSFRFSRFLKIFYVASHVICIRGPPNNSIWFISVLVSVFSHSYCDFPYSWYGKWIFLYLDVVDTTLETNLFLADSSLLRCSMKAIWLCMLTLAAHLLLSSFQSLSVCCVTSRVFQL